MSEWAGKAEKKDVPKSPVDSARDINRHWESTPKGHCAATLTCAVAAGYTGSSNLEQK